MSEPISIAMDVTNPGQFFACCGLLELAGRFDRNATAYFEPGFFRVSADVPEILRAFFDCDVTVETIADSDEEDAVEPADVDAHRGRTYPMILGKPFNLRLDWWKEEPAQAQKLKTWTAGQRVTDLLREHHERRKHRGQTQFIRIPSMRERFAEAYKRDSVNWLRTAEPIESPYPFGFDSRLGRNNALDLGHFGQGAMAFSPAVDVLTLVGFQRFRPRTIETWTRNRYSTWKAPLSVEIASIAILDLIPQVVANSFEFPVKRRDAQGRFKLFGHAQPVRRSHD